MFSGPAARYFVISAFDRDQWCDVLEARFRTDDFDGIRAILGDAQNNDPELHGYYTLDKATLAAFVERFDVAFDPTALDCDELDIVFCGLHSISATPYLVHTGFELPLLIDGRKKMARMGNEYPPMTFEGEDRFDRWVEKGLLHKEVFLEPFDQPIKKWLGHRTVYYTLKGEEWRIAASRLIWGAFGKVGPWNETLERLEGVLFGYEDWQNDWWIGNLAARGVGVSGMSLCCSVTAAELAWIELSGFRALPPVDGPEIEIARFDPDSETEMRAFMDRRSSSVALVRFNLPGRVLMPFCDLRTGGPWMVPTGRIPELNRHLKGSVKVVFRRGSAS